MVHLLDLPPEILDHISWEIHPADLVNFTRACKHLHAAATRALGRHRSLFKEYGHVGNHNKCSRMVYLPDLLKELLDNHELSFYVRRLGLKRMADRWGQDRYPPQWFEPSLIYQQCDAAHIGQFLDLAKTSGLNIWGSHTNIDAAEWYESLKAGSEEIIAALLITQMTHLSTLEWQVDDMEYPSFFFEILQKMVASRFVHPFSNLKSVILQHDVDPNTHLRFSVGIETVAWFMALPSVKTIHARNMSWPDFDETLLPPRTSNVSTIILSDWACHLHTREHLDRIVGCPRNLQAFTYKRPQKETMRSFQFLQQTLKDHARLCLQELTLRNVQWECHVQLESLSHFAVLRCLSTDLSLFLQYDEDESKVWNIPSKPDLVKAFKARLPPSLKDIRLFEDSRLTLSSGLPYLSRIVELKEDLFPSLSRLCLFFDPRSLDEYTVGEKRPLMEDLSRSCRPAQMEILEALDPCPW